MDPHHHRPPHHREEEERRRREEELRRHHLAPPPPPHHHPSPPPPPHHHPSPPPPPHHHPSPPPPPHHHPSPPPPTHHHHYTAPPPPPPNVHHSPAPAPAVQHVAHHVAHLHDPSAAPPPSHFPQNQKTVRIFPKAGEGYSLTIRGGQVVLAKANRLDPYQHWIKDERYSTKVKDKEGHSSFALVNKATGEAIMHSIGETQPVRLVRYNPDHLDQSILWTVSKDVGGGGFCGIRMVNNIKLNFDAFHGDKDHEGVHDGTVLVLWEWWKGDNELWKIVPYCKFNA